VCSSALSKVILENDILEPASILDAVSKELEKFFSKNTKKINDGMDISLICFDSEKDEIIFSGAHNSLIYIKSGEMYTAFSNKQPVGAYEYKQPFTQEIIKINDVDSLYLFSDGFPDQFGGPKNKKYSKKRFKKLLLEIETFPIKQQLDVLKSEFVNWRGDAEQLDDVTVVGFKKGNITA
jgi:serine phosphatase RsbU (regulator of sigma subunit)